MKKMIAIIAIAAATITTNAFAGSTTEVLQKKLDAAIAASDLVAAEKISAIMANIANADNQKHQAEFFRQQNEVVRTATNFYKAAPQMLRVVQTLMAPKEGTEEHFALRIAAPQLIKVFQTGSFDADTVINEWKKLEAVQEARRIENKKRWEEQRRKWEAERKQREAARAKRTQR
jgi:hypothetical protein